MLESPARSLDTITLESQQRFLDDKILPQFESMRLHFWDAPKSPARRLWDIVEKCGNMSGRTLRQLPALGWRCIRIAILVLLRRHWYRWKQL